MKHNHSISEKLLKEAEEYNQLVSSTITDIGTETDYCKIDRHIHNNYIMCHRFNVLIDYLAKRGILGGTLLSCGCGPALYEIALRHSGCNIWAYDNSEAMVKVAQSNFLKYGADYCHIFHANEITLQSILKELKAPCFDIIWGASILHHLADSSYFVEALRDFLGPKTIGIFTEPIKTPLSDKFRKSNLNVYSSIQTDNEDALTESDYIKMLNPLFSNVTIFYRLSLFTGLQKISRKFVNDTLAMKVNTPCFALDRILEYCGLAKPFTWHAIIIGENTLKFSK